MIRVILFCFLGLSASAQNWLYTGQAADLMVSGLDFNQCGGPLQWHHPNGLATNGQYFLLCDRFNNRILLWNQAPETWDDQPDLVLGQPDFDQNNPGTGLHQLNWPGNVSISPEGKIAVADTENDRILLWNQAPTQNGAAADVSLHLPTLTPSGTPFTYGWPWGVWTDGARLAAVATTGATLLFWNSFPAADNTPPDYTIRLPQFGTPRNISTDGSSYFFVGDHNAKVNNKPGTFFWNSFPTQTNQPYDFYRDEWIKGATTADGKLIAGGILSYYVWNQVPQNAAQNPDLTLAPAFYKNGDGVDVAIAGNRIYINNYNGNNVLVYEQTPAQNNQAPDFALGAPAPEAQTLDSMYYVQNPVPASDGQRLIVSSDFDRALYIWNSLPNFSGQPYDQKITVPPNVQIWANALYNNQFVVAGRNSVSVWTNAANLDASPDYILNNQIGSALLNDISGIALDSQFFYLTLRSGQVYVWSGLPDDNSDMPLLSFQTNGQTAFLHSDGTYLCAAHPEPPSGVEIFRVADLASGVTAPFKTISNAGQLPINQCAHAITHNGALVMSSRGNHAVLAWKNPSDWGNPFAAVVLGQNSVSGHDAAIGQDRLFMPNALCATGNQLWVGEFKFSSRLLRFSTGATALSTPEGLDFSATAFPNPCTETCFLSIHTPGTELFRIEVFDAAGSRRYLSDEQGTGSFSTTIPITPWPAGMYFLQVCGEKSRQILKILKQ